MIWEWFILKRKKDAIIMMLKRAAGFLREYCPEYIDCPVEDWTEDVLRFQEHINYAMPMRVMGYDYSTYKKQHDSNATKHKSADGKEEDEYLSRMKRTDRFMPVIMVTVYYGRKPWDGATSLYGMLDIPEELRKYVNDYRMLLVEARKNELALHNMNNVDSFNLLEILLNDSRPVGEIRSRAIGYTRECRVDKSVIMTAAGAVGNKIDYGALEQRGDVDMYTVFEEAVICADSACFYLGLISTEPTVLSAATSRQDRRAIKMNFPVRRYYFSESNFEEAHQVVATDFGSYQTFDLDRSVCDCIRFRKSIDTYLFDLIIDAYRERKGEQEKRLWAYARKLHVLNEVQKYL